MNKTIWENKRIAQAGSWREHLVREKTEEKYGLRFWVSFQLRGLNLILRAAGHYWRTVSRVMTQLDWYFRKITLHTVYRTDWMGTRTEAGGPIKKPLSICPHKDEHGHVHSTITHDSKNGNKQMSIYCWMDKQNITYPCRGTQFGNKKKWSSDWSILQHRET